MPVGTLKTFKGSWNSGIAHVILQDGTSIPCENAPTVRLFGQLFPGFIIDQSHTVNPNVLDGIEVYYSTDDLGLLNYIVDICEVSEDDLELLLKEDEGE